jgi:predicted dehydrogenase
MAKRAPADLRVAVLGCGYWGANLIRNFHALPGSRLVALADPRPERRAHMTAHYPDARVVEDHRQALSADVDAVAIATPPASHAALCLEALAAGKHVLVEKPMATSIADADAMIAAASAAGRTLMVGHTFEYNPAVELLGRLVAAGELGRIYYVYSTRVNLGLFQPDVNVVWDLAPHDLSILAGVLGRGPDQVRAWGHVCVQPGRADVAWLHLSYGPELCAQVHVSWLDPCKVRRVTVVGDRKMVVYDDLEPLDKIKIYDRGVEVPPYTDSFGAFQLSYRYGDVRAPRLEWEEPLRVECAHFVRCALEGSPPRTDGASGRRVVAALSAADLSLGAGGAPVKVS